MKNAIRISAFCEPLELPFIGSDITIDGLHLLGRHTDLKAALGYATAAQWIEKLLNDEAVHVAVVSREDLHRVDLSRGRRNMTWILSDYPEKTFYDIHDYLIDYTDFYETFDFDPVEGRHCRIDPTAKIDKGVVLGNGVVIGPMAVIFPGTVIEDNVTIAAGAIIGEEGFQVLRIDGQNRKIRHCGGVYIGENACIGSGTIIHRSLFGGKTIIGRNAMLDTLIYVGHNVTIGNNAVITSGVILCGSSKVENDAWIAPNAAILNKMIVGEGSKVGMGSVVTHDVPPNGLVYGVPAKLKNG